MSFYKMVAPVFLILDVLHVGQHPQSRGVTEIRTPSAPPQEGPYFSNDLLLGCHPTHKVPAERF